MMAYRTIFISSASISYASSASAFRSWAARHSTLRLSSKRSSSTCSSVRRYSRRYPDCPVEQAYPSLIMRAQAMVELVSCVCSIVKSHTHDWSKLCSAFKRFYGA